jgi:hypothetical protein
VNTQVFEPTAANLEAVMYQAQRRHAVEARARISGGKVTGYAFFDCDAYAIGEYNPATGVLTWYHSARFVSFHVRALMPVFRSWRKPAPNYTYSFLHNHGLPS